MNEPKYGVRYVCERFPDAVLGRSEPNWKKGRLYYDFTVFTPDMKQYMGSARVHKDFFNEQFKELI